MTHCYDFTIRLCWILKNAISLVARLAAAARAHAGAIPVKAVVNDSVGESVKVKELENKVKELTEKESVKETKEKEDSKAPKDTSRPVSSTPVSGTPWYFHYIENISPKY